MPPKSPRFRRRRRASLAVPTLALAFVLTSAVPAQAAESIGNGDFEASSGTSIPGWTAINGLIDLGTAQIAGCTTIDTVDYSRLPLYGYERGVVSYGVPPTGDSAGFATNPTTGDRMSVDASGNLVAPGTAGSIPIYADTTQTPAVPHYLDANGSAIGVDDEDVYDDIFEGVFGLDKEAAIESADRILEALNALYQATYPPVSDPLVRQDNVPAMNESAYWRASPQNWGTEVLTTQTLPSSGVVQNFTSRTLALSSQVKAETPEGVRTVGGQSYRTGGYVAHGPAVFSDIFSTTRPMNLLLDWSANEDRDYYSVLGYVLDVNTCQQIEVIDRTGGTTDWETASVTIPNPGDYRFVFVSGTYDLTWGTGAGANFWIDNIRVVPVTPDVTLQPGFAVTDRAASAPFSVSGGDLGSNTPWSVTLGPAGTVLGSGQSTVAGTFSANLTLPSDIRPGKYTLTLTGVSSTGAVLTRMMFITVDDAGLISYVSTSSASTDVGLAHTGVASPTSEVVVAAAWALLLGAGALVASYRRRRATEA